MFERKISDSLTNGSGKLASLLHPDKKELTTATTTTTTTTSWRRMRCNELTFSLAVFLFSLSVMLGKLCFDYGELSPWQIGNRYSLPSITIFARIYNKIGVPSMFTLTEVDARLPRSSEIMNATDRYTDVAVDALLAFYGTYWWLVRATVSGLFLTSFTWFIIYMDSNVPGLDPPYPFSSSRQRIHKGFRIPQMNYLVGMLNGVLFFIYMCL